MKLAIQVDDLSDVTDDTAPDEPDPVNSGPCAVLDLDCEFNDYRQDIIASDVRGVRWFLGLHF